MSAFIFYIISIISSLKCSIPHTHTPYVLRTSSLFTCFKALSSLSIGRKAMQFHTLHLSTLALLIINGSVKSIIIYFLWILVPPMPLNHPPQPLFKLLCFFRLPPFHSFSLYRREIKKNYLNN